jgi:hypothetical protein
VQKETKRRSRLTRNRRCPLAVVAAWWVPAWAAWQRSLLGFDGETSVGWRGFYRRIAWPRGQGKRTKSRRSRGHCARDGVVFVVVSWEGWQVGLSCQRQKERGAGTVSRRGGWAVGRFRLWSEFCPQGPFLLFFSFHLFFSDFIWNFFENKLLFDSNQFCNLYKILLCYHKHTRKGLIKETVTQTWENLCNAMMNECMYTNFEFIQILGCYITIGSLWLDYKSWSILLLHLSNGFSKKSVVYPHNCG